MKNIEIKKLMLGMLQTNCYIVINVETNECVIIDPGDQADKVITQITISALKPVAILLTHGHFDHIMAVNELKAHYSIPVYAHRGEIEILKSATSYFSGWVQNASVPKIDIYIEDNEKLNLAGIEINVYHTPGHTKGGCCFHIPDELVLFSGDTLFQGSIGRTDFPTGSMSSLIRSVKEKIFILPEETQVYPGHGGMTYVGEEKYYNPFF